MDERLGIFVVFLSPVIVAFSFITGFAGSDISSFFACIDVFSEFSFLVVLVSTSDFRLFFLILHRKN